MRLLLTRPRHASMRDAHALEAMGHTCCIAPVLEIVPREDWPPLPDVVGGLLFTSANAVRVAAAKLPRPFPDAPTLTVGRGTANAAVAAGFPDVRSADGDSVSLAAMVGASLDAADGSVVHLRGKHAAGKLTTYLRARGYCVSERILYSAEFSHAIPPNPLREIQEGRIDASLFCSPRSARGFRRLLPAFARPGLARTRALAMSAAVGKVLSGGGFASVEVAASPDIHSLFALLTAPRR